MCYRLVLFCNLLHAIEAWRTETFRIILINSIRLHIPRPSTRLGRPTVRISSYRYFIHHRLIRNSSVRHFILRRTTCSSSAPSLNQVLGVLRRHRPKRTLASDGTLTMRKCLCSYGERTYGNWKARTAARHGRKSQDCSTRDRKRKSLWTILHRRMF